MTDKKRTEVDLSDEERKFLYLCFKSKNINSFKKKIITEKVLNKLTSIFRVEV